MQVNEPKKGDVLIAKRPLEHRQWKTSTLPADKWKNLPKGTEVRFVKVVKNMHGTFWMILSPYGEFYTVEPNRLRVKTEEDSGGLDLSSI